MPVAGMLNELPDRDTDWFIGFLRGKDWVQRHMALDEAFCALGCRRASILVRKAISSMSPDELLWGIKTGAKPRGVIKLHDKKRLPKKKTLFDYGFRKVKS